MKTIQFRHYTLVDGEYDAFVTWFFEWMPRLRPEAGFTIEWVYGMPETNEFAWAVSAPVDAERFAEMDRAWNESDARREAFADQPKRVASANVQLVTDLGVTAG